MINTKHKHGIIDAMSERNRLQCIADYHASTFRIGRANQLIFYYNTPRKTNRWYKKVVSHFDISAINGY